LNRSSIHTAPSDTPINSSWTFEAAAVTPLYCAKKTDRGKVGAKKAVLLGLKKSLDHHDDWLFSPKKPTKTRSSTIVDPRLFA
jgi:hypothetical protein